MLAGTLALGVSAPSPPDAQPHHFLRTAANFSGSQLQALERGTPLVRSLDTDRREVAFVGAIRVNGPVSRLFDRYRDVAGQKKNPMVLEIGTLSVPPRSEDFAGLSLEDYDLETIRDCKPGDCGVRLSEEAMAKFRREVDWRAADWRQRAGTVWRGLLTDYAAGYLTNGDLAEYNNREAPLRVADEFAVLFDRSGQFAAMAPDFFKHLRGFPKVPLAGAESILYWSKDNFGIRPVVSMTHLTLYNHAVAGTKLLGLVGIKQIYAAHYFDAGLGLTMVFDDGASGFYVLCVNRVRTRSLSGLMRVPLRSIVQRRCRDALETMLRSMKSSVEKL